MWTRSGKGDARRIGARDGTQGEAIEKARLEIQSALDTLTDRLDDVDVATSQVGSESLLTNQDRIFQQFPQSICIISNNMTDNVILPTETDLFSEGLLEGSQPMGPAGPDNTTGFVLP